VLVVVQRLRPGRAWRGREVALGVDEVLVALLLTLGLVVVGLGTVSAERDPASTPTAPATPATGTTRSGPAPAVPVPSAQPAPAVPGG
jgi:hypothetical protein